MATSARARVFARQCRDAERGGASAAIGLAWAAIVLAVGLGWRPWLMLGSLFFLGSAFFERRLARGWERGGDLTSTLHPGRVGPEPGTFGIFREDGDEYYGATLRVGGQVVALILKEDGLLEARREITRGLLADPERLAAGLASSVEREASGIRPELAEELRALRLDSISFNHPDAPGSGEVYFTSESGGDVWNASYRDFTFSDFRQHS
jgi:hypothetical protein